MARTPRVFTLLKYDDPPAAIEWLVHALGFEVHFVVKDGGKVVHAQLRLGDDLLMISPGIPGISPSESQCVCLAVEDVDGHYQRARAAGATIVAELADARWGARLYTCEDPEGHIWTVGNYWGEPTV